MLRLLLMMVCCATCLPAVQADDQTKYVIIHADDAGMCHSENRATIDALEAGLVNSSSIMVPCPWFKEYAAYCKSHPEGDYGIHLTLNAEWKNYRWKSVAPADEVPSLIDPEGYLWNDVELVKQHALAKHVKTELRAQIERARAFGIPLSHLDTHMGSVACRADVLKAYIELGIEYDLPVLLVRHPDELFTKLQGELGPEIFNRLEEQGLPIIDYIYQFYGEKDYEKRKQKYLEAFRNLKPGISQVIIHCGYHDEEMQAITSSSKIRNDDRKLFMDPEFIKEIKQLDIKIVTWKEMHEITKAKRDARQQEQASNSEEE